jgi:hypothetical protein
MAVPASARTKIEDNNFLIVIPPAHTVGAG